MAFVHNERVRWLLTAFVVVLAIVFVLRLRPNTNKATDATLLIKASSVPAAETLPMVAVTATVTSQVAVDVIGAVQQPGVYYLDHKARVADAVSAAGGLSPDAARDQINLAAPVVDGTQIRVPHVGEVVETGKAVSSAAAIGLVNINTADIAALDALPGVGPATSQAIIDKRTSSGPFKQIEDIQDVKGIGPSLFAELRTRITVGH